MSLLRIDLARADHPERKECRHAERSGNEENRLVRNEITGRAHSGGSEPRAEGGEAGVTAKPLGYCRMSDKAKANGGNRWSQDAACSRVQQLGRQHHGKDRPRTDQERTCTDCQHSTEVCIKYDEMADFVISRGLARELSKDEALHILENCEKEGLVHMVDNAQGQIKHTCNCCGHYCWNVGIIRRRKIPRDSLMAVYFTRETITEECIGCGACEEICPVDAVRLVDEKAEVDPDWCIGCGVCAVSCPTGAISIKRRSDAKAPEDFKELHRQIKAEKGLGNGEKVA